MRIIDEFRSDMRAARKIWLPWRVLLLVGMLFFAVVFFCNTVGKPNMALPLANIIGVFGFTIYAKRELARHAWFWGVLAGLAAIHAVALWSIPWSSAWVPALAIGFISSIDFSAILLIIIAVKHLVMREGR